MSKTVKVKETVTIYFQGNNIELIKGNEVQKSSDLFKLNPELFESTNTKTTRAKKSTKIKAKSKKDSKEELKEELLVEEPVAELKVQVEEEASE